MLALSFSGVTPRRARRVGLVPMLALAGLVALVSLIPLLFIIGITLASGWPTIAELVLRPKVFQLLGNTLLLEVTAVPAALALAVALAWLVERTDLPGRRLWAWLMIAPLAVPAFVHSYSWNSLFPTFTGALPAVLVAVLAYFPFAYLPVAAQLRRLDPALEETAASLGLQPWAIFSRVVLPQLRLALCAGGLLIALHLLAEYGLFVLMRFDTFATAIVDQFQSVYNGPAANLLGGVLVLLCLVLLSLESLLRGGERYARVGAGAARGLLRRSLGRAGLWYMGLPLLVAALALGVPMVTLGRWLLLGGTAIWRLEFLGPAVLQTAGLALASAVITTLAAIPIAWLSVRAPSRVQRWIEGCHYYVGALPGLIVALALVTITVRVALPLYQTLFTLLFAYLVIFLPRALVGLRASMAQAPVELERMATSLGRSPFNAVCTTTLRLAAPGAMASAALVALGVANELTGTLMLAPNGTRTLATRFWAYASELDFSSAAPYALLLIILSLPLVVLLRLQSEQAARP